MYLFIIIIFDWTFLPLHACLQFRLTVLLLPFCAPTTALPCLPPYTCTATCIFPLSLLIFHCAYFTYARTHTYLPASSLHASDVWFTVGRLFYPAALRTHAFHLCVTRAWDARTHRGGTSLTHTTVLCTPAWDLHARSCRLSPACRLLLFTSYLAFAASCLSCRRAYCAFCLPAARRAAAPALQAWTGLDWTDGSLSLSLSPHLSLSEEGGQGQEKAWPALMCILPCLYLSSVHGSSEKRQKWKMGQDNEKTLKIIEKEKENEKDKERKKKRKRRREERRMEEGGLLLCLPLGRGTGERRGGRGGGPHACHHACLPSPALMPPATCSACLPPVSFPLLYICLYLPCAHACPLPSLLPACRLLHLPLPRTCTCRTTYYLPSPPCTTCCPCLCLPYPI